jgi:omega-6 fatty acid desaturase (delta-12 desaturase)
VHTDANAKPVLEHAAPSTSSISHLLADYRKPKLSSSLFQLIVTLVLWAAMWPILWWSLSVSYWLTLPLLLPSALLSVRLFILQHDCGHGSFFPSRTANELVGYALGVFTLTPYHLWRREHATHHAGNGNLDQRGTGDIDTLTIREYNALPRWRKFAYRLYRSPFVLFGIGPIFHFAIRQRFPQRAPKEWHRERKSVHLTNLGIFSAMAALIWLFDWRTVFLLYLPVMTLASSIGVWLFYVQHQFNPTYWQHSDEWDYQTAAIEGSSYYHLPAVLRWFTGNIGFHHIHHLDSRVPNYRLPRIYRNHPELQKAHRLTLLTSIKCAFYKLWDEERQRLVTFREARRVTNASHT